MVRKNTYLQSLKKNLEYSKTLPREERLPFFWDYYKVAIITFIVFLSLACIVLGTVGQTAVGALGTRQSISLAIAAEDVADCENWAAEFSRSTLETRNIQLDLLKTSGYYEGNAEFEIELVCWLAAGQPDLLICDADTLHYCEEQDILADLAPYLSGKESAFWIEISDTAFAREHGAEAPLYLCHIINSTGSVDATALLLQAILEK